MNETTKKLKQDKPETIDGFQNVDGATKLKGFGDYYDGQFAQNLEQSYSLDGANLLPDRFATFEYFSDGATIGTVDDPTDGIAECTKSEKYLQSRCLHIQTQKAGGALSFTLADAAGDFSGYHVPTKPLTDYVLSMWIRTDNTVKLRFEVLGNDTISYPSNTIIKNMPSSWTRYFVKFRTGPATTGVQVKIIIDSSS
jgi:hypothetical protein